MSVHDLAGESFVSLTTYRRNGEGVATRSGSLAEGGALVVTTVDAPAKVKRLRNNPEVTLRPCNLRGTVAPDAVTVSGTAEVITDPGRTGALTAPIRRKYGLQFRVVMGIEKLVGRGRFRVALRITDRA